MEKKKAHVTKIKSKDVATNSTAIMMIIRAR